MKAKLSTAQVMSLYSGFAYCDGPEIRDAIGFMIGHPSPDVILGVAFQPDCKEVLLQQHPWLKDEAPTNPNDWIKTLKDAQLKHGAWQTVADIAEHRNGIVRSVNADYPKSVHLCS